MKTIQGLLLLGAPILFVLAATGCGSSKSNAGSGASAGSAGSSGSISTGSSSGSTSATGASEEGGCFLGVQGLNYAGCPACATCWQMYCCDLSNACLNDPTCSGYLSCQANCYNGQGPDGGNIDVDASIDDAGADGGPENVADLCAASCLPDDAGAIWNTQLNCISPKCDMPCLCP